MVASAQGIDISAYQAAYSAAELKQYAFAFFKAANGASETDPNFAANWAAAKAAGIHRGAYLELVPTSSASAVAQATHFAATVKAHGVEPGDMVAVVSSDYNGVTGPEVLQVLQFLRAALPECPALVYSDEARLPVIADCKAYPLWIAAWQPSWPATPGWTAKFWQWSDGGGRLDHDAYNGTAAELTAWLSTFKGTPLPGPVPKPVPVPAPVPQPAPSVTAAEAAADLAQLQEFVKEHG